MIEHWVARTDDIPDDRALIVQVNAAEIGLFRIGDEIVAFRNICPHSAAPVCRGVVAGTNLTSPVHVYLPGRDGEILQCPWHGWEFDLKTGEHLAPGSRAKLHRYRVEVRDGEVYVLTRR
jgi:nitrite reductase/ring-hydroxylating ferredoxin subunit